MDGREREWEGEETGEWVAVRLAERVAGGGWGWLGGGCVWWFHLVILKVIYKDVSCPTTNFKKLMVNINKT